MTAVDSFRLDGKAALVTGASSGLGAAFAAGLASAGADIVLAARRTAGLERTAESVRAHGRRADVVRLDITDSAGCDAAVHDAVQRLGRLDILVNNAGLAGAVPATRESDEHFRSIVDVNLMGTFWMARAAARVMEPGSAIVNVSSVLGLTAGQLPQAAYTAAKTALIGLTRDLAVQWSRQGIRVNSLAPGVFATEMTQPLLADPDTVRAVTSRTLLGRLGEPDELVGALLLLVSPAGKYMTATTVVVDGGMTRH